MCKSSEGYRNLFRANVNMAEDFTSLALQAGLALVLEQLRGRGWGKPAPRIGWSTSARRNWNWKRWEPNCRGINLEPLSVQLRKDEEIQILTLRCQVNSHGLTGHLEGT